MSDNKQNVNEEYIELNSYAKEKYLSYAISVAKGRAIPYSADGLKPVQRRILFGMNELSNYSTEKHKKSARIVGEVMGKYHPHGDSSIYEAKVRMSQPWVMRYPLVDGQGNFGTRDGDNAAAMRYTEARLTPFTEDVLLSETNKEIITYVENFDGSLKEPSLFASKLNLLLLNGASGIAVGMATEIPSHNMKEINAATILLINNPESTLNDVLEHIKGPDFAEGGQIVDNEETIKNMYASGRGSIKVRSRWKIEHLARGQWQVAIYELPPTSSVKKVLEKIDAITNPPIKKDKNGKPKGLTAQQQTEKAFLSGLLEKVRDESDKDTTPIRLVLHPKSSRQDPEQFMNSLIKILGLQENYPVNLTSVGLNGKPECRDLITILNEWISFRFETLTKRTKFELKKASDRIHILDGRMIIYLHLDEVIDLIKSSDDPKADLIQKYALSEIQADDILEIKLRQLAKMESAKIEKELNELHKLVDKLNILLNNKKKMNQLMINEIQELDKKYGDERRTIILEDTREVTNVKEIVSDEPLSVYFTDKGWITSRKGHNIENENIPTKQDDKIIYSVECSTNDEIAFIGTDGRSYSVKTSEIPSGKTGYIHINTLISPAAGVKLKGMTACKKDIKMLFFGSNGYGFITNTNSLATRAKAGKSFLTIDEKEDVMEPILLNEKDKYIAIRTSDNRILSYSIDSIKELDKGKGVMLAKLDNSSILEVIIYENSFFVKKKNKWVEISGDAIKDFSVNRGAKGKVNNDILSIASTIK